VESGFSRIDFMKPAFAEAPAGRRGSVLASAALGAALTPLNSTMVAVALPALGMEFNAPAATVTLFVITGYLVATIVSQMPAGSIADRVGYARALTWGRWTFGVGAAVGMLAPSLPMVVVGRLLMAAGGALIIPTAMALVRIAVPPERRSRAFGIMGSVMGGAAALGPALGSWMTEHFGWRSLFVINVPLLLLSWILQPRVVDDHAAARRRPSGYLSLLRNRAFMTGAGVISTQNLAMYSLLIQVPFLFGGGEGADAGLGLAIIAMTFTMAAISPIGGWLAEWVGVKLIVAAGGLIAAVGVAALGALPSAALPRDVGMRLLIVGLGLGLSTGPANAAAISAVQQEQSGIASATISMLRYFGAIAGTLILSLAFAPGADVAARQHLALWAFVAALVVSAVLGVMLPPLPGQRYFRPRASASAN
jgi:MFS family permease